MKSTSTTTPNVDALPTGRARVGRLVLTPSPKPANDAGDRQTALAALVDDLAALAVGLYFSDLLPTENADEVMDSADKWLRGDV